jgi:mannose-6-phosphate isomerase-like protein (cupin superfamily)
MSYPEPRYLGDTGEISATYRPSDHEPELTYPTGVKVDYLATGASTDGEFGLYRWTFGPKETGPGPHFHKTISESFFILTGTVRVYDGKDWVPATSGDYLFVPPGGIHGFRNVTGDPASMLILFTPGAPREAYFEGLVELAQGKQVSDEERDAFYLRHDNYSI